VDVSGKNVIETPALTLRPHGPDSMVCISGMLFTDEGVFGSCRLGLPRGRFLFNFAFHHVPAFQSPSIGWETGSALTRLSIRGVRGDPIPAFSLL